MKKLLFCLILVAMLHFVSGCMFFPHTYDGSEQAYQAHPEWTDHTPAYMNGSDTDDR